MLVTNRKPQQTLILTDPETGKVITVSILSVKGNSAKVGVEAPETIRVLRGELEKEQKPCST